MMPVNVHPATTPSRTSGQGSDADAAPVEAARAASAESARAIAIDHVKAIGIILVVFGHSWRGMCDANLVRSPYNYGMLDTWIYAFHMPLFFFVSGLFIERAAARPLRSVLVNKAVTLLYPYLIWSVLQAVIQSFFANVANKSLPLSELPYVILLKPYSPFWFLYVLFMADILFVAARRARVPQGVILLASIALFWSADHLRWLPAMYLGKVFVFFCVGAMVSAPVLRLAMHPPRAIALAALPAAIVLSMLVVFFDMSFAYVAVPAGLVGIAAVLFLGFGLSRWSRADLFSRLGLFSLQIYLMHILCTSGIRIILHRFLEIMSPAVHLIAGVLLGLAVPVSFWLVAQPVGGAWLFRPPLRNAEPR